MSESMHDHHRAHGHGHSGHGHHSEVDGHAGHAGHVGHGSSKAMAVAATLHCLTGCAIGEMLGLVIGTAVGLSTGWTIAISVSLAFFFGYLLSTLPLLKSGLALGAAFSLVLAADTVSIATMEVVDNAVMALIPGAMDAGLVNPVFWVGMMIAFTAAFVVAYPVNRYLLQRGKGHALTHEFHGAAAATTGARRYLPSFATSTLVAVLVAFLLGGLLVSVSAELGDDEGDSVPGHAAPAGAGSSRG